MINHELELWDHEDDLEDHVLWFRYHDVEVADHVLWFRYHDVVLSDLEGDGIEPDIVVVRPLRRRAGGYLHVENPVQPRANGGAPGGSVTSLDSARARADCVPTGGSG